MPADLRRKIEMRCEQFHYTNPWDLVRDAIDFKIVGAGESVGNAFAEATLQAESLENELRLLNLGITQLLEVHHSNCILSAETIQGRLQYAIDTVISFSEAQ